MGTMPVGAGRLLAGGALITTALGSLFAWSLFVAPLAATFDSSPAALAAVFSVAVMVFAAIVLAGGTAVDRRRPRTVALAAAVAAAGGLLLASRAPSLLWVAVGYGGLFGIGNGLGYATAVAVAGKGFGERRGLALGIVVGAYAAGPLVASPAITAMLAAVGWRGTFTALAAAIGVALVAGALLLGDGLPGAADRATDRAGRDAPERALLLRPAGLALWAAFLLGTLPAMLVVAHAASIAAAAGLAPATVGAAVALLGAGNLAGRAGGGWVSDRVGRLPGLRTATVTLAASCLGLAVASATLPVLVLMVVVGIGYGTQSSLVPALTADLFGAEHFGANYGRVFTGWGVAGLLGPQLGAALGDPDGGWAMALALGAASAAGAFGLHVLLGRLVRTTAHGGAGARRR
jgi:OFA family oxalate/formate antiporter-like MFS transporter